MPLPSALLQRLKKRGIITNKKPVNSVADKGKSPGDDKANLKEDEEIIAENYDETEKNNTDELGKILESEDSSAVKAHLDAKFKGHLGCPNTFNVWHKCTQFCKDQWGDGIKRPNKQYLRARRRMLEKYPLPVQWCEVYDPGSGRYYYWDEENDAVSWLPPTHPRSVITDSAAHFREEMYMVEKNIFSDGDDKENEYSDSDSSVSSVETEKRKKKWSSSSNGEASDHSDGTERKKKGKLQPNRDRKFTRKIEVKKTKNNDLDPMDPAAYSDIPRGGWSEGLNKGLEAKTGADTTAAGPLYQMRPYPNPGAVLRANAKLKADD